MVTKKIGGIVARCFEHMFLDLKLDKECQACKRVADIAKETEQDERVPCEYSGQISFPMTEIASGATIRIVTRPQIYFKPKRIVVDCPDDGADDVIIDRITIGQQSQLSIGFPSEMPGGLFKVGAWPMHFKMDVAPVGCDLGVTVVNRGKHAVKPLIVLFGDTMERRS